MYSRNNRGKENLPLKIPENYGGSFLFPNTRMPNPPPIYSSDEKMTQSNPITRHKEGPYIPKRKPETEKRIEQKENSTHERHSERPWYDGNVIALKGESEACEECKHHDNCDGFGHHETCNECENCDKYENDTPPDSHNECPPISEKNHNSLPLSAQNLLPLKLSEHFPFGHGLGFEELFILGLILVLFQEKADEQIILFLIILLFCG